MADERPNPLKEVASKVGLAWAAVSGIVGALITYGVFTAAQGEAIANTGAALPGAIEAIGVVVGGLIPLIGAITAAFRTAAAGADHVTPVSSPRDNDGNVLVPAPSATATPERWSGEANI